MLLQPQPEGRAHSEDRHRQSGGHREGRGGGAQSSGAPRAWRGRAGGRGKRRRATLNTEEKEVRLGEANEKGTFPGYPPQIKSQNGGSFFPSFFQTTPLPSPMPPSRARLLSAHVE